MNDGYHSANATMMAVLGREAAYSGRVVKWDELVEKGRSYFPDGEITNFQQPTPVQPDADGFYESSVPVPGVYNPFSDSLPGNLPGLSESAQTPIASRS